MKNTDPLVPYKQKRNFTLTPEPVSAVSTKHSGLSFVIQKHASRKLHYDFRLELDGTLKSWAIPKGPSLDPAQKRMAVHVEDHPLSYAEFEGVIPAGQYGAGTVIVWDCGTWEPLGDPQTGFRAGTLKFKLHGEKLKGGWTLVRMRDNASPRQEAWLLIKERDAEARSVSGFSVVDALPGSVLTGRSQGSTILQTIEPKTTGDPVIPVGAKRAVLPLSLAPQLATMAEHVPTEGDWLYEIKFDGYRILARIDEDDVHLFTRNGHDWTHRLSRLASAVKGLNLAAGWLDGEIVILGPNGNPDFGALQNALDGARSNEIQYFVFDLPFYAGFDLREVGVADRRALLSRLLSESASDQVRFSEDFEARGSDILYSACRMGLEGVIGKRRDSPYISLRSPNWIKLKCTQRQEFVVAGYTGPQGTRRGIGALLLGVHDEGGNLRYVGRVGTGFDTRALSALKDTLSALTIDKTPYFEPPREAKGNWVIPKLVAEVSFSEWTRKGIIRHAVFQGLRDDKPAASITRETASEAPPIEANGRTVVDSHSKSGSPEISGSRISNPDRTIDLSTGLTKLDLVNYYLRVAERMLPHLAKRPVAFLRAPSGIQSQLFFQKHGDTLSIPELKELDPALDPGHPAMMEIDSLTALIGAAQMNVVEFHTWNATTRNIEKPDRVIFDLDPGEGLAWPLMLEAAQLTRTFLDELGLQSFLKTSGGGGLHVVVPLAPSEDWDTVEDFSRAAVRHLATVVPSRFVSTSGPRNRVGKVFVDYLRNRRGATTVAAFSARARLGVGISMPCSWQELPALTGGAHWTVANAHERLQSGEDPWVSYSKTKQTLTSAIKKLIPL